MTWGWKDIWIRKLEFVKTTQILVLSFTLQLIKHSLNSSDVEFNKALDSSVHHARILN